MTPDELARQEGEAFARQGQIFRPLAASATDPDHSPGVPCGLDGIDSVLGGGYRTGLHLIVGYSHNGKTQLLLRSIWENRDRAMILFTPDETTEMVILKLLSLATGEHVDAVFQWTASRKAGLLNEVFPKLVVNDDGLAPHEMIQLIGEAEQVYQERAAFVAFDYLEVFGSAARGQDALGAMKSKVKRIKQMAKDSHLPWLVLHQLNRGGSKGKPVQMTDLSFGGEQEAFTITACWRQYFDTQLSPAKRQWEEFHPSIHVSVIKNKQRPALEANGIQYAIDPNSGLIREMGPADMVMTRMSDLQ